MGVGGLDPLRMLEGSPYVLAPYSMLIWFIYTIFVHKLVNYLIQGLLSMRIRVPTARLEFRFL